MLAKLQIAQDSGGIPGHQLSDKRPAQLLRSSAPMGASVLLLDHEGGAALSAGEQRSEQRRDRWGCRTRHQHHLLNDGQHYISVLG